MALLQGIVAVAAVVGHLSSNMAEAAAALADLAPVQLPVDGAPTHQFCLELEQALLKASWAGVHATARVMPADLLQRLAQSSTAITSKEPTLLEVCAGAATLIMCLHTQQIGSLPCCNYTVS